MTRTFCDWCGKEVLSGAVGTIVNLTIQPAFKSVELKEEICPDCADRISALKAEITSIKIGRSEYAPNRHVFSPEKYVHSESGKIGQSLCRVCGRQRNEHKRHI